MSEETTTVEVTYDIWAALDKRKDRGDSFNDVIERLINSTPAPVGAIKEDAAIEGGDMVPTDADEDCSHFDTIAGETCDQPAEYEQEVQYADGEPSTFYYCDDHAHPSED